MLRNEGTQLTREIKFLRKRLMCLHDNIRAVLDLTGSQNAYISLRLSLCTAPAYFLIRRTTDPFFSRPGAHLYATRVCKNSVSLSIIRRQTCKQYPSYDSRLSSKDKGFVQPYPFRNYPENNTRNIVRHTCICTRVSFH